MGKAKDCIECAYSGSAAYWKVNLICELGHKPRFYVPKTPDITDLGWKRVCDDFSKKKD